MLLSETTTATILGALCRHVDTHGDVVAYTFLKSNNERLSITYRELDQRARCIACGLLQRAEPADRALLMYPAGLEFIEAFLGCLYAGIVAVPAYPPKKNRNVGRILSIADDCTPRLLLCALETKRDVEGEFAESVRGASVVVTDELDSACKGSLPEIRSDQLAFLQYTSGSTAAPKGVMVSHGNIVANELLIQKYFQFNKQSIMVSWLPMFHDMGLIGGILAPLFVGFPSVLMPPNTFLREPIKWLRAVTEFRGTCTGAPNFAYDLCVKKITEDQKNELNLESLKIAYNGAEPVRAKSLERFANSFAICGFRKEACFPCYGMAETTLLVSGGPPLAPTSVLKFDSSELARHRIVESDQGQQIVSCGQVTPNLEVCIVNSETFWECQPNEVGEIWVFGNSVAHGYWNRHDETQESFHVKLNGDDRCWFRTGDYGFVRAGELYVTGRLKDLIIVRGRNIYPQDIEEIVEQYLDFVEPNFCAAFSIEENGEEKLVIVAEGSTEMMGWPESNREAHTKRGLLNCKIEDLRVAILNAFEISVTELVLVRPATFPRTSSGKVQRRIAKQKFLQKEFEIVFKSTDSPSNTVDSHPTSDREIVDVVFQTLEEWARDEGKPLARLRRSTTFRSLGIDSLAAADIGMRLERKLGVNVEGDTLYAQRSIGELAEHLIQRIPRKSIAASTEIALLTKDKVLKSYGEGLRRFRLFKQAGHDYFATEIERQEGAHVWVDGRKMLMMASYSYLGLINLTEVNEAAHQAICSYGTGAHGVRLLAGTFNAHLQIEQEIAEFFDAEDAIVYSSGFMTNLATIAALVSKGDIVIGDELNHASIVDGCAFSEATFLTFAHNNTGELERILKQYAGKKILVVVDAVYSMDGDIAPLPRISDLCHQYGALLMVDEAHSLGVIGATGRGIQEHFGLAPTAIDIKMGTLSKAVASCGGFIAARQEIVDFLKYNARGFIFSAALPAGQVGAARKCLEIIQRETHLAQRLRELSGRFVAGLRELGFNVPPTESAIVPIVFSSEEETLEAVGFCREHGLFVVPVFYPAVPMDKPRIRATVMASFDESQIDEALEVFAKLADTRSKQSQSSEPGGGRMSAVSPEAFSVDHLPGRYLFSRNGSSSARAVNHFDDSASIVPTISDRVESQTNRFSQLRANGSYFYDTPIQSCDGAWVTVDGQRLLMLASYNYLGFISDDEVLASARRAIDQYGIGQHGSRLVSGTTSEHKALERELADFMQAEDAIVFNSGYVTNLATIAALVGKGDTVIGDEWNHACIVDGCRLSGADFQMFRHNDLCHLEQLLSKSRRGNTLVAVDAVYSMEGDIAPIPEIVALCKKYGALLMVDEAHSIGTIGKTGRGVLEHFGLPADAIDIKMGTLSKSLGACGGFIASSSQIIDFLRHHARGYVFSGAMPVPQVVAVRTAIGRLREEPQRAVGLIEISRKYRNQLRSNGFNIYGIGTQIVPIACETDEQAFRFTKRCRELGLYVIPIVYPAVPMNAPRVRTNLTMLHTDNDIKLAVELLTKAGHECGVIHKDR